MSNNFSESDSTIVTDEGTFSSPVSTSRRSSIFKRNVASVPNDDGDEAVKNEYQKKVSKEYRNWRQLYLDVKNELSATKEINSKPAEDTPICSESYQELLAKAENYVEKANEFFDQMNCISTMNQNAIQLKQLTTLKLEQKEKIMKENLGNMLSKK